MYVYVRKTITITITIKITNTSFSFSSSQERLFTIAFQGSCNGNFCKIHRKASMIESFLVNLQFVSQQVLTHLFPMYPFFSPLPVFRVQRKSALGMNGLKWILLRVLSYEWYKSFQKTQFTEYVCEILYKQSPSRVIIH